MRFARVLFLVGAFSLVAAPAYSSVLFESFDDTTTLLGNGWNIVNNSSAGGTSWFQGNPGVFSSQAGAPNAYIASNFGDGLGGDIDLWLMTPTLTVGNGTTITFYTQTEGAFPGDNLDLLFSSNGSSTAVSDFSQSLVSVASASYPQNWTQYTYTFSGLGGSQTGRFGFHYTVTDTSANGDYIGIDTVLVNAGSGVPEPSTFLTLGAGLALVALKRVRSRT